MVAPSASPVPAAGHQDLLGGLALVANAKTGFDLSPPARALIGALDTGVGAALGLGSNVSEAGAEALAGLAEEVMGTLGQTVADIVGNIGEAIPYLGPIIKAVASIVSLVLSGGGPTPSQRCASLFTTLKPFQTGSLMSGGPTVPADFFARAYGIERLHTTEPSEYAAVRAQLVPNWASMPLPIYRTLVPAGPHDCRPAIGMMLMQITEGYIADLRDFDWPAVTRLCYDSAREEDRKFLTTERAVRRLWRKALDRDPGVASLQWKQKHPFEPRSGLPRGWRDRFRRLRRAIEASWGPRLVAGASSDGGVALWIAYLRPSHQCLRSEARVPDVAVR